VITLDLRHAIGRAVADAGLGGTSGPGLRLGRAPDPGLRPGGEPGQYASSVAFELAATAKSSTACVAAQIAERLEDQEPWIKEATVTGRRYVTVTVTLEALEQVADRVTAAGPDCVRGDALAGQTYPKPTRHGDPLEAATWEEAWRQLAAELTARLAQAAGAAEAAGATEAAKAAIGHDGRVRGNGRDGTIRSGGNSGGEGPAAAVAFAGRDAVRLSMARIMPGQPVDIDPEKTARHHLCNPAYAVRYAHARAASGVRWAATTTNGEAGPQRRPADPGDLALLDALSWLPERVVTAARRGRPDEFARYLERVADVTLAALTRPRASGQPPGSDRLVLARAARAGLAAGLELLGVTAPDRL
jgi:arginyl-tRNA synthetase